MSNSISTLTTAGLSLCAVEVAPQVAQITADAVQMPIQDTIQIIIQVITGIATLYKLFFHKPKQKNEENV